MAEKQWITNDRLDKLTIGEDGIFSQWGDGSQMYYENSAIGPPRSSKKFTKAELEAFGMVGIYGTRGRALNLHHRRIG